MFRRSTLSIRWRSGVGGGQLGGRSCAPGRYGRNAENDLSGAAPHPPAAAAAARAGRQIASATAANARWAAAYARCTRGLPPPAFLAKACHRVSSTQVRQWELPTTDFCLTLPCRERSLRSRLVLVPERTPREYATKSCQEVSQLHANGYPTRTSASRPAPLNPEGAIFSGVSMGCRPVSRGLHFTSGSAASLAADRMATTI